MPAICRELLTVDEACETKPPVRVERLATNKVEEAFKTPEVWKLPDIVEEAEEINPPTSEERESAWRVE